MTNAGGNPEPERSADDAGSAKKVLIIMMPFATPEFPGLGPTLIRSILEQQGIPTDIVYGNLVFSKLIAADPFVENTLTELPICELAFTPYYFSTPVAEAAATLRNYVLELTPSHAAHPPERYLAIVENAGRCVDTLFQSIRWQDYDVVGFSLLMGQTVASLALAKRIKAAHPQITVIVGGAHTQAPMGDELLRSFPEIDYVLQGEADGTVAPFVRAIRAGARREFSTGGVLFRDEQGRVTASGPAAPFTALDSLPVPDFSEFFAQMDALGLTHIQPYLPLETSRGCWWGEKHHCTFCGIDDAIMVYRSKSSRRVLDEIATLSQRFHYTEFFAVDSIINFKFFGELLPVLGKLRREHGWDLTFFFESKSNVKRDQVRRFRYGGVNHVQPGLESFSDHVLELMNKGTTGARQIQCLRLLAEYGIVADWNLIYGNPGETSADYRELGELIPYLHHLPPLHAGGLIPMQINRYAPYFNEPERHGLRNLRPRRYYPFIYPDPAIDLSRLAFYFDCEHEPASPDLAFWHQQLKDKIDNWRACYVPGALTMARGPGFVTIVDRRSWAPGAPVPVGQERRYLLEGAAAEVFLACNELTSVSALIQDFATTVGAEPLGALIDELVERRLVYRSAAGQLIALPLLLEAEQKFRFEPAPQGAGAEAPVAPELTVLRLRRPRPAPEPRAARPLERLRLSRQSEAPGEVALSARRRPPGEVVAELVAAMTQTRALRFRLEDLPAGGERAAVLDALAVARAEHLWGFELTCELAEVPTDDEALLLREAGVVGVALAPALGREQPTAARATLQRLAAAKSLSAVGIAVTWQLDSRALSATGAELRELVAACRAARHLPPPERPTEGAGELARAVEDWAATHQARTLTYARGPGFLRVFDRRAEDGTWRFVTLREQQAQVLLRCAQPRSAAELHQELAELGGGELRSLLDALVAKGLAARGDDDHYLALPIRRSIEERWASGDH